jgi:hypothetical protein
MLETVIVLVLIALLAAAGWAAVLLEWQVIALAGAACAAFGFALGVPTGFYYHVLLYRFLQPRGLLPRGWYWHPMRYHDHLQAHERPSVHRWMYAGGAGFVLIVLGLAFCLFGILLAK